MQQHVWLEPLRDSDREQFVLDNQEAFLFGATQEFGMRDDQFSDGMFRFEKAMLEPGADTGRDA